MMAMPLIGAALSIGQAAAGYGAASKQASEQNAYYEQNRLNAVAAANDRYAALAKNTIDEKMSSSQQLIQKRIEALKARSKAAVAAGEGGVTGLSVEAMLGDYEAQEGRQLEAIHTNFDLKKQRNVDDANNAYHNTINRINSVRQASKPSALPFILQGLGGAMGAFSKAG
jgi:hypothetical protein